ncbi:Mariner Mos1 transposase [Araneus ventricosus]|uniref:Mariner Mos1 transposase n=1 Tax=Araneus ventricosus TaxID=182803 RepID=A0A4Y2LUV3_ARAVE|nr:Mariner Mos1 transposase [Araneus ventricosus]
MRMVNMHHRKTRVNAGLNGLGNSCGKKTILYIWWDQESVMYHELFKSGEDVNSTRYQQQIVHLNHTLILKRPQLANRHDKVILLHDNASPHTSKPMTNALKYFACEVLPQPLCSPDLAPSDFHLIRSIVHTLSQYHFRTYDDMARWIIDWFASNEVKFKWDGIHTLPDRR